MIWASGLRKRYGDLEAVRGIDLAVHAGEVFAFLGPNGAGKTTTVEILEGYRRRDAGEVRVLGADPAHPTLAWRARIGLVLQASHMPPELTVRELVERYAGYYPRPRDVGETIALVGLGDKRKSRAGRLSGGQVRRLDVALALVGDPDLLFLDEPTTGFDPAARRHAWHLVESLKPLGKTVFLPPITWTRPRRWRTGLRSSRPARSWPGHAAGARRPPGRPGRDPVPLPAGHGPRRPAGNRCPRRRRLGVVPDAAASPHAADPG